MERERSETTTAGTAAPSGGAWTFGPADMAIAAGLMVLTLAACVPGALRFREEARRCDAQRVAAAERCRELQASIAEFSSRQMAAEHVRSVVERYTSDVASRRIVPWDTVVGELSRRRPEGVWTTRLSANGSRFTAEIRSRRPELVSAYLRKLSESPYVEFVQQPAPAGPAQPQAVASATIVGRLVGE